MSLVVVYGAGIQEPQESRDRGLYTRVISERQNDKYILFRNDQLKYNIPCFIINNHSIMSRLLATNF